MDAKIVLLAFTLLSACLSGIISVEGQQQNRPAEIYPSDVNVSKPIYFGLMMSFGGSLKSSGVVPGVQVALDIIKNISLLGDYSLHYVLHDSQCNRTNALDEFFSIVLDPNKKHTEIALIGAGCSSATFPTAEVSHYYNMTQISCTSDAEELSDRTKFRLYYQLLPSEGGTAQVFAKIIQEYEWKRVMILVQDEPGFLAIFDKVKMLLPGVSVDRRLTLISGTSKISTDSENYFDSEYRIYVLLMTSKSARQILCKAHARMMYYPKYIFLTYGTYEANWWVPPIDEDVKHECTSQERARVLNFSLSASNFQFIDENNTEYLDELTSVEITRGEYLNAYKEKLNQPPHYFDKNSFSSFCFDATWSLALAIKTLIDDNNNSFNGTSRMPLPLQSLSFTGISGLVKFDGNGIRKVEGLFVKQYRMENESNTLKAFLIAKVICKKINDCIFNYTSGQSEATVWIDGVPYDGVPKNETKTLDTTVSIILGSFSLMGLIFTFVCLIFNYACRDRKIIRLTSPNVNYILCVGCMLLYFSNAILSVQPTINSLATSILCLLNLSTHSVGYTLAFATILAKLGRIYLIFRSSKKKITVKDKHLFIFIFSISSVPVIIFTTSAIYTGINSGYVATKSANTEKMYSIDGIFEVQTDFFFYKCVSNTDKIIAVAVSYGYIFFLKLIALWLAFQIRKVKITGLNDSRYIAAIVYINSILVAINIVIYFSLPQYITVFAIFFGTNTLICTTVIIGLVFLPKMISLCRNPTGEGIFGGTQNTTHGVNALTNNQPSPKEVEIMMNRIITLEKTVKDLKGDSANLIHLQTKDAQSLQDCDINKTEEYPTY